MNLEYMGEVLKLSTITMYIFSCDWLQTQRASTRNVLIAPSPFKPLALRCPFDHLTPTSD